jgi:hypothetical protein
VPALIHDAHEISATLGRGGDIAGPQAVSPESRGIVSGRLRAALDEVGDGSVVPSTIRIICSMEPSLGPRPYSSWTWQFALRPHVRTAIMTAPMTETATSQRRPLRTRRERDREA